MTSAFDGRTHDDPRPIMDEEDAMKADEEPQQIEFRLAEDQFTALLMAVMGIGHVGNVDRVDDLLAVADAVYSKASQFVIGIEKLSAMQEKDEL